MNKKILIGVGALVLLGAGGGGAALLLGGKTDDAGAPAAAQPDETAPLEVFYHHVQPEFVVNLPGSGRARFLMVELSIAIDDERAKQVIEEHQPELRNDLLMLLGEQDAAALVGNEGKAALRERASEVVDTLVAKHYAAGHVLDTFLTRFVIQ